MTKDEDPADDEGPIDKLRRLLESLEGMGERDGAVDVETDYEFTIGTLDDLDRRTRPSGSRRTRHPRFGSWTPDREEADDARVVDVDDVEEDIGTDGYHVDVHEDGDVVELRADLPGVDAEDVTVEVDGDEVVVRVGGDDVERVPLPREDVTVTDVAFNNGVLVGRLEPTSGGGDEGPGR